jgi:hypothetical protein
MPDEPITLRTWTAEGKLLIDVKELRGVVKEITARRIDRGLPPMYADELLSLIERREQETRNESRSGS